MAPHMYIHVVEPWHILAHKVQVCTHPLCVQRWWTTTLLLYMATEEQDEKIGLKREHDDRNTSVVEEEL